MRSGARAARALLSRPAPGVGALFVTAVTLGDGALEQLDRGGRSVVPGRPGQSGSIARAAGDDRGAVMAPKGERLAPKGERLAPEQVETLRPVGQG